MIRKKSQDTKNSVAFYKTITIFPIMLTRQHIVHVFILSFLLMIFSHDTVVANDVTTEASSEITFSHPIFADDIVAIVNNDIITMSQLVREMYPFISRIRSESRSQQEFDKKLIELRNNILNAHIERILIVADFKSKGGQIPESYEKKEYENHIREYFNDDRVSFAQYLRDHGQSVRDFKRDIKDHAIVRFVLNNIQDGKSEVSPNAIKEYYNSHIQDFTTKEELHIYSIIFSKTSDTDILSSKIKETTDILSSCDDIITALSSFKDDPKTTDMGWVSRDEVIPAYSDALSNLSIGQYSLPINTDDKTVILVVTDIKPSKTLSIDEAKSAIEQRLWQQFHQSAKESYIQRLKDRADIKLFLDKPNEL